MPTPLSLRNQKKQQTRDHILTTARGMLAEQGFEATTMKGLAQATQLSYQTLYNYFPTKADIVQAMLVAEVAPATAEAQAIVATFESDLLSTLAQLNKIAAEVTRHHNKDLWREVTIESLRQQSQSTEFYNLVEETRHGFLLSLLSRAQALGALKPTADCTALAHALYATSEFCFLQFVMSDAINIADMIAATDRMNAVIITPYLA